VLDDLNWNFSLVPLHRLDATTSARSACRAIYWGHFQAIAWLLRSAGLIAVVNLGSHDFVLPREVFRQSKACDFFLQ
jgi:hypothetical protein